MLIKFPIGDWSGDGHGQCDWYIVESNKTVEEIENIQELVQNQLGFKIRDMCGDYEEECLTLYIIEILLKNGILTPKCFFGNVKESQESFDKIISSVEEEEYHIDLPNRSDDLIRIWLEILKFACPDFEYSIIDLPAFYASGSGPGYGLFQ